MAMKTFPIAMQALTLLLALQAYGQQKILKLPPPVNHPSFNASSPYISLDGSSIIFVSDNAEDNVPTVFFTSNPDGAAWKAPAMLPKSVNSKLNFFRGYGLSGDGKQMFISSTKGGGLGGYDIYVSNQAGAFWEEPANVGQPVNSTSNEACASLTTDGLQMYFMRCEKMDYQNASGCKLWVASRRSTTSSMWSAPVELPAHINTGNSQSPRIMGDGETLIFSSDKLPGKGGMDLFMVRREGESWSQPVPLDFVNSLADNQFVSAVSNGRYLMTEQKGQSATELVQLLFPAETKPKAVMRLEGHVSGLPNPSGAYISLLDRGSDTKVGSARPDKNGNFFLYLKEGIRYSVAIDPEIDTYTFFTKDYDLTTGRINTMDRLDATLKPAQPGDELLLDEVVFKPQSAELEHSSHRQLDRAVRLMKSAAATGYSIEVDLYGYMRDSVQSSPELTEVQHDTVHYIVMTSSTDSTGLVTQTEHDSVVVKTTYHNDRTVHQALEVVNYLIGQGVPSSGVQPVSRAFEAIPEERKTLVKLKVR
jgi:hypothetical protein